MILNIYNGNGNGLRTERKVGWQKKFLNGNMLFYHGGPMSPHVVKQGGLDAVIHGNEWLVDSKTNLPIGGGKLLFTFLVGLGDQMPVNFDKSPAIRRLWGADGHGYVFLASARTEFYSMGQGQPQMGQEIAFPYRIVSEDIRYYCTPDTRGMHGGAGRSFQVVPWQTVLNAR